MAWRERMCSGRPCSHLGVSGRPPPRAELACAGSAGGGLVGDAPALPGRGETGRLASRFSTPLGEWCAGECAWKEGGSGCAGGALSSWPTPALMPPPPLGGVPAAESPPTDGGVGSDGGLR